MQQVHTFKLNNIEHRIMKVLWAKDQLSSREIAGLIGKPEPAFSTLSLALRILEHRGILDHQKLGNRYFYRPLIGIENYLLNDLDRLVDAHFSGDFVALFKFLVLNKRITPR